VFCSIVAGDIDAVQVDADETTVVFLDRSPLFRGHVLVVPRLHVATLAHLPADQLASYFGVVQRVSAVMPDTLDVDGTFVAMNNTVSQSVPHLHTHVVPRRYKDGLRGFFWPRQRYANIAEMESFAARLRDAMRA